METLIIVLMAFALGAATGVESNREAIDVGREAVAELKLCEIDLPRWQHCEIYAMPEEEDY